MNKFLFRIATALSILISLPVSAQKIKVTASLDSAEILMGYTTRLRLRVEQPSDVRVRFPLLKDGAGRSYIPLLNDSVELSTAYSLDTTRIGRDRMFVDYNMTVQAFDSGYYKLPGFRFECDGEFAESNPVELRVLPVHLEADAEISGFTGVEEPEPLADDIDNPDSSLAKWLKSYWWLCLTLAALCALLIWAVRKYRREGTLLPVKPVVPPYDEANKALDHLRNQKLWESGKEKQYYTDLTFILRRYLAREYQIPALEMTTGQLMHALSENPDIDVLADSLTPLLDTADFVKYAKVRPLPGENEQAYDITRRFITDAHRIWIENQEKMSEESKSEINNQSASRRNIKVAKGAKNKKRRK